MGGDEDGYLENVQCRVVVSIFFFLSVGCLNLFGGDFCCAIIHL